MASSSVTLVLLVTLVQRCSGNVDPVSSTLLDRIEALERRDKEQCTRIERLEHEVLLSNIKVQRLSTQNHDLLKQLTRKTKQLAKHRVITTALQKGMELLKSQGDVSQRKVEIMQSDIQAMSKRLETIDNILASSEDNRLDLLKGIQVLQAKWTENTDEIENNDVVSPSTQNPIPDRSSALKHEQVSDKENEETEWKSAAAKNPIFHGIKDMQSHSADEIKSRMVEISSRTPNKRKLNERHVFPRFVADGVAEGPVAFQAVIQKPFVNHMGINQNIVFEMVQLNLGNGYHNQHGLFIAPKPGLYIFSTSVLSYVNAQAKFNAAIVKNGNILATAYGHGDSGRHDQGSVTIVTQLNVGDEVCVRIINIADDAVWGDRYTTFMGILIFEM